MMQTAFARSVRDSMWQLLSTRYRTNRRDRQTYTADEFIYDRPFWPEFTFESVGITEDRLTRIVVVFHETKRPENILGFRIDLDAAMSAWSERVGGRDPRLHPEMFAAELVWFMVCYIGVADIDHSMSGAQDEPQWINQGSEIFGKLKSNPNMETFESH